jgi:hypothetical protein
MLFLEIRAVRLQEACFDSNVCWYTVIICDFVCWSLYGLEDQKLSPLNVQLPLLLLGYLHYPRRRYELSNLMTSTIGSSIFRCLVAMSVRAAAVQ